MPNPATTREQRLRKTKAQLIDEIDTLEQRAAAIEATNQELAEKEAQLLIALNSMPGLLVYTDENLNIVLCNERFSEMYQAQREMLQPGATHDPISMRSGLPSASTQAWILVVNPPFERPMPCA